MSGTPSSPDLDAILTDRYRIERQIGAGGMASSTLRTTSSSVARVALQRLAPAARCSALSDFSRR
jgi:hypothetical protein